MENYDALKQILEDELGIDADEIVEEKSLKDDYGADSMDLFQIFTAMEMEYDIELDSEETNHVRTVGDLMQIIKDYT